MGYNNSEKIRPSPEELALIKQRARIYADKESINPGIDAPAKTFFYHGGRKNSSYEEILPVFQMRYPQNVYGPRITARELIESLVAGPHVPTVLDVGCGKEPKALEELRSVYGNAINLWGFDLPRVMLQQTPGFFQPYPGNVVDLTDLIPQNSVDVVIAASFVRHVHPDVPRIELLANFAHILKPGGFGFVDSLDPVEEFHWRGGSLPHFDEFIWNEFGLVKGNESCSSFQKVK